MPFRDKVVVDAAVPLAAVKVTVTVVDAAATLPVTDAGLNEAVTPDGSVDVDSTTGVVKPAAVFTVRTALVELPGATANEPELRLRLKLLPELLVPVLTS